MGEQILLFVKPKLISCLTCDRLYFHPTLFEPNCIQRKTQSKTHLCLSPYRFQLNKPHLPDCGYIPMIPQNQEWHKQQIYRLKKWKWIK